MIVVQIEELEQSIEKCLRRFGYPEKQLHILIDVILYAILRGNLQFIIQACANHIPSYQAKKDPEIVYETALSVRLNGQDNYGIVVMQQSAEMAIKKAAKMGFGIVSSFRSAPPGTGDLGYYVNKIAEQGLIGFAFSGSSKHVALEGSHLPALGSNPFAIAFPTLQEPLVIDFATSSLPIFKIVEASLLGQSLDQEGYDEKGKRTRNPAALLKGALEAFGGRKGSALALAIEILTGPLTGSSWLGQGDVDHNWGNLVYALDPAILFDNQQFKNSMSLFLNTLHPLTSETLPGEKSHQASLLAQKQGFIQLDEELYRLWRDISNRGF